VRYSLYKYVEKGDNVMIVMKMSLTSFRVSRDNGWEGDKCKENGNPRELSLYYKSVAISPLIY